MDCDERQDVEFLFWNGGILQFIVVKKDNPGIIRRWLGELLLADKHLTKLNTLFYELGEELLGLGGCD